MLACGLCSHAVTIDMSEAPDNLTEELIYYSDFDTGEADVNEIYIHLPWHAQSGTARMGTAEGYGEYWREDIKYNGNCQSKSYTLSFDLHELKGRDGACMLSMYTEEQLKEFAVQAYAEQMGMDPEQIRTYIDQMSKEELIAAIKDGMYEQIAEQYGPAIREQLKQQGNEMLALALDAKTFTDAQYLEFFELYVPATYSESTLDENLSLLGYV